MSNHIILTRKDLMSQLYFQNFANREWSPITSTIEVDTSLLINYLGQFYTNRYTEREVDLSDLVSLDEQNFVVALKLFTTLGAQDRFEMWDQLQKLGY